MNWLIVLLVPFLMPAFKWLLALSTAIDGAAAIGALWLIARHRVRAAAPRALGPLDLVAIATVTTVVFVVKLPVLRFCHFNLFGMIHLMFLDLALVVPLVGACVLGLSRVGVPGLGRGRIKIGASVTVVSGLALLAAPVAAYSTFAEPYWLAVEETAIPVDALSAGTGPIVIAVLADLQFSQVTAFERDAVDRAMQHQPDVIVLPGDLFQGTAAEFQKCLPDARNLLSRLHAPGGVYIVQGNTDSVSRLARLIDGADVRFLNNEVADIRLNGLTVAIGGVRLDFASSDAQRTIVELDRRDAADLRILVTHRPDAALTIDTPSRIDLVIAGHTHGGQVQIPGFGPLMTLSGVSRRAAGGGLTVVNDTRLYVSRGVGSERGQAPLLRFCCRPELSILTLAGH